MEDYETFEGVLLRKTGNAWIVKLTGDKLNGQTAPIGFNVALWEGGEPMPGKPTKLLIQKWWANKKLRNL